MILTGRSWTIFCLNLIVHSPPVRADQNLLFSSDHLRDLRLTTRQTRKNSQPGQLRYGRSGCWSGRRSRSHLYLLRYGSNMLQVANCCRNIMCLTTHSSQTNKQTNMNIRTKQSFPPISSSLLILHLKRKDCISVKFFFKILPFITQ